MISVIRKHYAAHLAIKRSKGFAPIFRPMYAGVNVGDPSGTFEAVNKPGPRFSTSLDWVRGS